MTPRTDSLVAPVVSEVAATDEFTALGAAVTNWSAVALKHCSLDSPLWARK
jgi:hypothetical protein